MTTEEDDCSSSVNTNMICNYYSCQVGGEEWWYNLLFQNKKTCNHWWEKRKRKKNGNDDFIDIDNDSEITGDYSWESSTINDILLKSCPAVHLHGNNYNNTIPTNPSFDGTYDDETRVQLEEGENDSSSRSLFVDSLIEYLGNQDPIIQDEYPLKKKKNQGEEVTVIDSVTVKIPKPRLSIFKTYPFIRSRNLANRYNFLTPTRDNEKNRRKLISLKRRKKNTITVKRTMKKVAMTTESIKSPKKSRQKLRLVRKISKIFFRDPLLKKSKGNMSYDETPLIASFLPDLDENNNSNDIRRVETFYSTSSSSIGTINSQQSRKTAPGLILVNFNNKDVDNDIISCASSSSASTLPITKTKSKKVGVLSFLQSFRKNDKDHSHEEVCVDKNNITTTKTRCSFNKKDNDKLVLNNQDVAGDKGKRKLKREVTLLSELSLTQQEDVLVLLSDDNIINYYNYEEAYGSDGDKKREESMSELTFKPPCLPGNRNDEIAQNKLSVNITVINDKNNVANYESNNKDGGTTNKSPKRIDLLTHNDKGGKIRETELVSSSLLASTIISKTSSTVKPSSLLLSPPEDKITKKETAINSNPTVPSKFNAFDFDDNSAVVIPVVKRKLEFSEFTLFDNSNTDNENEMQHQFITKKNITNTNTDKAASNNNTDTSTVFTSWENFSSPFF